MDNQLGQQPHHRKQTHLTNRVRKDKIKTALALRQCGASAQEISEILHQSTSAIFSWLAQAPENQDPALTWTLKRHLGHEAMALAHKAFMHISEEKLNKSSALQLATIIGIMIDKVTRLLGMPHIIEQRSVHVNLYGELKDLGKQLKELDNKILVEHPDADLSINDDVINSQ